MLSPHIRLVFITAAGRCSRYYGLSGAAPAAILRQRVATFPLVEPGERFLARHARVLPRRVAVHLRG